MESSSQNPGAGPDTCLNLLTPTHATRHPHCKRAPASHAKKKRTHEQHGRARAQVGSAPIPAWGVRVASAASTVEAPSNVSWAVAGRARAVRRNRGPPGPTGIAMGMSLPLRRTNTGWTSTVGMEGPSDCIGSVYDTVRDCQVSDRAMEQSTASHGSKPWTTSALMDSIR